MTVTGRGVNRARVAEIGSREEAEYRRRTPRSAELFERARHVIAARRRELLPGLRPLPAVHDRCARQPHHRCRRQRVHRLRHGLRRARRRPLAPAPRGGAPVPGRERDLLHLPGRGRHRAGGGDQAALRRRSRALQQLGHRSDDGRDSRRPRLHRPREDHQVRGRLPRPPRRRARQHPAAPRGDGIDRAAGDGPRQRRDPALADRGDGDRAVQRAGDPRRDPRGQPRRDRGDHHRARPVQHRRRAAEAGLPGAASASSPPSTASS